MPVTFSVTATPLHHIFADQWLLPWQCNSPVTPEPSVDQNTKATCTQASSIWLQDLKPSPTREHRSLDKQTRIAVQTTDAFQMLIPLLWSSPNAGQDIFKNSRLSSMRSPYNVPCSCLKNLRPWSGGSHLFFLSFLDAPCPASHQRSLQTHWADPLYLWNDRWANYHKTKNGAIYFSNSWLHYLQGWRGVWRGKMASFTPCLHLWSLTS